ncbi:MAG: MFS transporter, partial [Aquificota bacterium]
MSNYKEIHNRPMFRFLLLMSLSAAFGLQGWRVLFNNFAVEVAHISGKEVGIIQSFREIPGFLSLLVVYILLWVKEYRLSAYSIIIMGFGVFLTGFFPNFYGLILTTLIMSFGFHYYETTNQSLTLQYFKFDEAPYVFGKIKGYSSA